MPPHEDAIKVYTDMDLWVQVRRYVLVEGHSKRSACRKFGLHWKTLTKMLEHSEPPGYVPASKLGAELLFDVISLAYERTSVIVTTNLPFERWVEVLGCERLTGAALDRLTHRCHVLEANGQSYRLKDATRRQQHGSPQNRS